MRRFAHLVRCDLRIALRQGSGSFTVLAFFAVTVLIFPFGVGPDPEILSRVGAGIVWVVALLATLLSLDRLFAADYEDGGLELLMLAPIPLEAVVLAKCLAQWLVTGLPLLLLAPLLALMLNMEAAGLVVLILAMLLGTPFLLLVGAIGAALTLGLRRGGVLLSLIILPLYVPVLIFGVSAVNAGLAGEPARAHLLILGGLLLAALVLAPWATAAALRQSEE
jgi:heme exporter protein B